MSDTALRPGRKPTGERKASPAPGSRCGALSPPELEMCMRTRLSFYPPPTSLIISTSSPASMGSLSNRLRTMMLWLRSTATRCRSMPRWLASARKVGCPEYSWLLPFTVISIRVALLSLDGIGQPPRAIKEKPRPSPSRRVHNPFAELPRLRSQGPGDRLFQTEPLLLSPVGECSLRGPSLSRRSSR